MLIGICSDTHGNAAVIRRALALFDLLGAEQIVHCGDVGGPPVFDELVGRIIHFAWGNTDAPDAELRAYLETLGIPPPETVPLLVEWNSKRAAVFHGHEPGFRAAAQRLPVDYILHGHTHAPRDERVGSVRVINPGALCRTRVKTVATLDLEADELIFHVLPPA